jgi:4,5-dihydroxyphthalate decarboxylase
MKRPELTLMTTDYHRTHALFSGAASIKSAQLKVCPPPVQGDACYKPVYEIFDVAEMSLSWYLMARCRGEPLIALPIFPLRMFIHPYIFCRDLASIAGPEDLKGKTVGIQQYRITVGLWTRGTLGERHGVHHTDVNWISAEPEGAGYRLPADVTLKLQSEDIEALLLKGALDAAILPNVAGSFRAGDPRIRRVFSNCRASIDDYFHDTGIFPITHTLVAHERLVAEHPWLCAELLSAFDEADRRCRVEYEYPKRFSFPTAALFLEEEEQRFGKNPWSHGVETNRVTLEKFVQYAREQGYISFMPGIDELFAAVECLS